METFRRLFIAGSLIFCTFALLAQETLPIDTTSRCIYSGRYFGEALDRFSGDAGVERMIARICAAAGYDKPPFEVVNATVPSVAAVVSGDKRYLLYDRAFFYELRSDSMLAYALLAHEVGHLLRQHKFKKTSRLREETEADEFMGRILFRLEGVEKLEPFLDRLQAMPYSHGTVPWEERKAAIVRGWKTSNAIIQGDKNLGFYDDKANNDNLPLPRFVMSGCPARVMVPDNKFSHCRQLKDVDKTLCAALDAKRYEQRAYYYVKNGFAVVTAVEQTKADGTLLNNDARWQDTPYKEKIDGLVSYLTSLMWSAPPAKFRFFVFVVTDQSNLDRRDGTVGASDARNWLQNGGLNLPESIGNLRYTNAHHVYALVYEFEAPETNKQIRVQCQPRSTALTHLERSGLLPEIKRR